MLLEYFLSLPLFANLEAIDESCSVVTLLARPLPDGEGGKVSFISKGDIGKVTVCKSLANMLICRLHLLLRLVW